MGLPRKGLEPEGAKRLEFLKNSFWGVGGLETSLFPDFCPNLENIVKLKNLILRAVDFIISLYV